jgi:hypothetical protein
MERASQLLLASKAASKLASEETVAQASFRAAVGKRLAAFVHPGSLEGGRLHLYVEDGVWREQLIVLAPQILDKMHKIMGRASVRELQFRVMPGRRGPARATTPVRDDSEEIADPMLRRIFRRKQA